MSLLELGHPSWERDDADGVAQAMLRHRSCISVRILSPEGDGDGWSLLATYEDPQAPRQVPVVRIGAPVRGGRR